jgi:septum formation protein
MLAGTFFALPTPMPNATPLVLASASPRRSELLRQIGVDHDIRPAYVDESVRPNEAPEDYVRRVCEAKARVGAAASPGRVVLAADTAVVVDGELFGKPRDLTQGLAMLRALSGRTHRVLTAIALAHGSILEGALSDSRVTFRELSESECRRYWATGEPEGKAGGYAIQGFAATFITRLEGSYSGVMGLPLAETALLLARAGVPLWVAGVST